MAATRAPTCAGRGWRAKLITLGSPHHGSWLAKLGIGPPTRGRWSRQRLAERNQPRRRGAVAGGDDLGLQPQDNYVMPPGQSAAGRGPHHGLRRHRPPVDGLRPPAITRLLLDELAPGNPGRHDMKAMRRRGPDRMEIPAPTPTAGPSRWKPSTRDGPGPARCW